MARDVTKLAERIHNLQKRASMHEIACLMRNLNISIGEQVEYMNTHVDETVSTGERLREIHQARKRGRELRQRQQENVAKMQQAKKDKREKLMTTATELKEANKVPELDMSSLSLDDIDLSIVNTDDDVDLNIDI